MNDDDLQRRLRRIGDAAAVPATSPADDLARGRRRVRRTRLGLGGGAVLVAAAVTLAAVSAGGDPVATDGDVATEGPTASASTSPTTSPTTSATPDTTAPPTADAVLTVQPTAVGDDTGGAPQGAVPELVSGWEDVLAEHLDPDYRYLVPWGEGSQSVQSSATGRAYTALGSKYSWKVPGESGEGMLQLVVASSWTDAQGSATWGCALGGRPEEAGWTCREARVPAAVDGSEDVRRAELAEHDGVREVAVTRTDGGVVRLVADPLFGNNSLVAVSGFDLTDDELVATAVDPRLTLPTDGSLALPAPVDRGAFLRAGLAHLVDAGERLTGVRSYGGGSALPPAAEATWHGDGATGLLQWRVLHDGEPGQTECDVSYARRCEIHSVAGHDLRVTYVRGGGWQIVYAGPVHVVLLRWDGRADAYPIERTYAVLLDPRWQRTG